VRIDLPHPAAGIALVANPIRLGPLGMPPPPLLGQHR
jgi:hypothetical protein